MAGVLTLINSLHLTVIFWANQETTTHYSTRPDGYVTGNIIILAGDGEKEANKAPFQVIKACKHKHG